MALVVEDGSLVTGANSYNTLAEIRAFVTARGGNLPAADASVEAISQKAMDYFESYSSQFKGQKVERDQALSFPRTDLEIDGWTYLSTEIPNQAKQAQLQLILEINNGEDPFNPPVADQNITRETVGPITVEYSSPNYITKTTKSAQSSVYIGELLRNAGGKMARG